MKEIFSILFKPNSTNIEKLFSKTSKEKNKLFYITYLILAILSFIIYYLRGGLINYFFIIIFVVLILIIISASIIFIISKILKGKGYFLDYMLMVNITGLFYSITFFITLAIAIIFNFLGVSTEKNLLISDIVNLIFAIWGLILSISIIHNAIFKNISKTIIYIIINIVLIGGISYFSILMHENQLTKARDTFRMSYMSEMSFHLEEYYFEKGEYPEKYEDTGFKLEKDPLNGKIIDGCEFVFKYEKTPEKGYKISTCLENEENKQSFAKGEKRYEIKR